MQTNLKIFWYLLAIIASIVYGYLDMNFRLSSIYLYFSVFAIVFKAILGRTKKKYGSVRMGEHRDFFDNVIQKEFTYYLSPTQYRR